MTNTLVHALSAVGRKAFRAAIVTTMFSLVMATGFVAPINYAEAALAQVGPINPITTFPAWYSDSNGLALDLMEAADSFGLSDPVDPTNAFSQQIGFNAEGFWWMAEATPVDTVNSVTLTPVSGILVLALEAAFAGEAAVDGEQSTFGRIRYRIDGLVPNETYTVTHPYGTATEVADIDGSINVTSDIGSFGVPGFPANFAVALSSGIGPFLTWDTFGQTPIDPLLVNPANPTRKYIGNPAVEHAVTGGPNGNSFSVTGPGLAGFSTNLFTVTGRLADSIPPVITLTGGTPFNVTAGTAYVEPGATATDQVDLVTPATPMDPANIQITSNVPAGILTLPRPVDEILEVVYSITDGSGNTGTATRTVNVVPDIVPPVITILGNNPFNILVDGNFVDPGATSTDNVDGVLAVQASSTVNTAIAGAYTVTYTATDSSNNTTTAVRNVNVTVDGTAPVITITGGAAINVTAGTPYVEQGATALDDFDGVLPATVSTSTVPAGNLVIGTGPFTVTYTATDLSGNVGTAVRTVTVVPDTVAPEITLNGTNPMNAEAGTIFVDPGATATDLVDGPVTVNVVSTVPTTTLALGTGPFTVTYTATDTSNNTATLVRTVNVAADATAPVITMLGNNPTNVLINTVYSDAGATATDNIDLSVNVITTGLPIDTTATGTFTVTYTATDSSNNVTIAQRTVNVVTDIVEPVITLNGTNPATVFVNDAYADAGATALDDVDGNVSAQIQATSTVNTAVIGSYTVTYTVSDAAGNIATAARTVNVIARPTGGGGGGGGGGIFTPTVVVNNSRLVINAGEAGVSSRNFGNGIVISLEIPQGTVGAPTRFDIGQNGFRAWQNPVGATVIGDRRFDITAKHNQTEAPIILLKKIKVTIITPALAGADTNDLHIYYFDEAARVWRLVPGAVFSSAEAKVVFEVDHLTDFAIFRAAGQPATLQPTSVPTDDDDNDDRGNDDNGQVLGVKIFPDGTLIRGKDGKIFVVVNNKKRKIANLDELRREHRGVAILNVDDATLAKLLTTTEKVLGVKLFANGALIKTNDGKIFVIENGMPRHIKSIAELRRDHRGKPVTAVSDDIFNQTRGIASGALTEGSLVRSKGKRDIFVIRNGQKVKVNSLDELRRDHRGKPIIEIDDRTLAML